MAQSIVYKQLSDEHLTDFDIKLAERSERMRKQEQEDSWGDDHPLLEEQLQKISKEME